MHHDEIWQVYAPNGEPISGVGWSAELANPEETGDETIVGVAIVFLYRVAENGELEFLWQKRSAIIDRYPNDWDISAGGHINLGESVVEGAVREAREEIGVEININDLNFVTMWPFNKNRFAWIYAVDWSGKGDNFHFDDKEVSEVKWVPLSEMEEFRKKYAKEPLKNDRFTFEAWDGWLRIHGYL